ncbi:MAG TPA: chromophore lyase CpcT/CpeT [Thermoanaerobaculia bacterium]|nr:chromophore lyase CpcT/CpeT [Thermoanaerobaculia bacterium]HQN06074.1 chromophore lyase CpcT/CpeT [Thermoanaerobaculia bacterium]HQP85106.1 chromophore lyase CpcT/CpeT [Thermoanaerobaculia bacterium]
MRRARFALSTLLLAGVPAAGTEPPPRVEEVAALLTGTFDSSAQSGSDPEGYRAVRLVAVRVPASRLGAGAPVLYVEQALLESPDRPYRQRFYRIEETADGGVVSRVFEPKEPIAVSGKWRDPSDLALYGAGDVVERLGCAVRLMRTDDGWRGSTEGKGCPSALAGARWATSEVTLRPGRMESWDRGYDVNGRQVWGARNGPYVFERRSDGPPAASPK